MTIAAIESLGITMNAKFVPFSQSRNAKPRAGQKEPWRSLNWIVTLERNGKAFIETDYSQGVGHCPASKNWKNNSHLQHRAIAIEIETGFTAIAESWGSGEPRQGRTEKHRIAPPAIDEVLHSLIMDSSVLDYASFEDWAPYLGFDADSREAEKTYQACLAIALKLRAGIGEAGIETLRIAFEDY